jgi:hypothetical protein
MFIRLYACQPKIRLPLVENKIAVGGNQKMVSIALPIGNQIFLVTLLLMTKNHFWLPFDKSRLLDGDQKHLIANH